MNARNTTTRRCCDVANDPSRRPSDWPRLDGDEANLLRSARWSCMPPCPSKESSALRLRTNGSNQAKMRGIEGLHGKEIGRRSFHTWNSRERSRDGRG